MQNILKKGAGSGENLLFYDFGDFRLDVVNEQLLRDGKPIYVTQKSLEILQYLIKNRGRLLKKKELLKTIWADAFVEESTVTQHIYMLRKVFKENSDSEVLIETISKNGYRFIGPVREVFEEITPAVHSEVPGQVELKGLPEESQNSDVIEVNNHFFLSKWHLFGLIVSIALILLGITLYFNQGLPRRSLSSRSIDSIAVLPFQQINAGKDEDLGLGMADVIIAQLGKVEDLRVTPTSSIVQYVEDRNLDLFEVGRKLNVKAVLIGTIHREGEEVRVTYQVYRVTNKQPIISDKIDGKYINMFALQDSIAERIRHQLAMVISETKSASTVHYPAWKMGDD